MKLSESLRKGVEMAPRWTRGWAHNSNMEGCCAVGAILLVHGFDGLTFSPVNDFITENLPRLNGPTIPNLPLHEDSMVTSLVSQMMKVSDRQLLGDDSRLAIADALEKAGL